MKLRTGFVSNSSSSSFILAVREDKNVCPHCGRRDIGLYELIETSQRFNYSDETEIKERDKEEVIEYLEDRLREYEGCLEDYKRRLARGDKGRDWYNTEDQIANYTRYVKETQELAKKVKKAKGDVFRCNINHHDDIINNMIKDLQAAGRLEILEKDD